MIIPILKVDYLEIKTIEDVYLLGEALRANNKDINNEVNISQLARELNVSRDTIRRNLNGFKKKGTRNSISKIDLFKSEIEKALNNPKKKFKSKAALYKYLKRENSGVLPFAQNTFRHYINKNFKESFNNSRGTTCSTRYETEPGVQFQFDFKESVSLESHTGTKIKFDIGVLQCGYSRKVFRRVIPNKKTETVLAFLIEGFEYFGGTAKSIVVDNCKALVAKFATENTNPVLNNMFSEFLKDFEMECYVCVPYRPETKGKVERTMTQVDELDCYNGEISDVAEIGYIINTLTEEFNNKVHSTTKLQPNFMFKRELNFLRKLPNKEFFSQYKLNVDSGVKVDKTSMIKYDGKFYSVPNRFIGQTAYRVIVGDMLDIYINNCWSARHLIIDKLINKHPHHDKVSGNRSEFLNNYHKECAKEKSIATETGFSEILEQTASNFESLGKI